MDVTKALRELYAEKQRLDTAIAALEEHLRGPSGMAGTARQGRKKMSPEERLEVSRRMSKYWETKRAKGQMSEAEPSQAASDTATSDPA